MSNQSPEIGIPQELIDNIYPFVVGAIFGYAVAPRLASFFPPSEQGTIKFSLGVAAIATSIFASCRADNSPYPIEFGVGIFAGAVSPMVLSFFKQFRE